jgi:hypothetical protein
VDTPDLAEVGENIIPVTQYKTRTPICHRFVLIKRHLLKYHFNIIIFLVFREPALASEKLIAFGICLCLN